MIPAMPRAPAATPGRAAVRKDAPALDVEELGPVAPDAVLAVLLALLVLLLITEVIVEPTLLVKVVVTGPVIELLLMTN
jgi:hypothetical protein